MRQSIFSSPSAITVISSATPYLHVDSSTLFETLKLLRYPTPQEAYPWAWRGAIEATTLLLHTDHFAISPGPSGDQASLGLHAKILEGLRPQVRFSTPTRELQRAATQITSRWASRNIGRIRSIYEALLVDEENFSRWLESSKQYDWPEHASRLSGMFDVGLIPQIGRVLGVSDKDLRAVHELSCDTAKVGRYAKASTSEAAQIMTSAFIVSGLIRGRYHDNIARAANAQIMHHPMRSGILQPLPRVGHRSFGLTNSERFLSTILITGAFAESSPQERISLWLENVSKVKAAANAEKLDLREASNADRALDRAMRAVLDSDIRLHPRANEVWLDIALGAGVGALTSFVLQSWPAFLVSVAAALGTSRAELGERVAGMWSRRKKRLHELATYSPGRVAQRWRRGKQE